LSCPLCRARRLTKWYHEDDDRWEGKIDAIVWENTKLASVV